MPRRLSREEVIQALRAALQSAGSSPLLNDGVPEDDLLAMSLDIFFAKEENLNSLVLSIKSEISSRGGEVLLAPETISDCQTFADLLKETQRRLVVQKPS